MFTALHSNTTPRGDWDEVSLWLNSRYASRNPKFQSTFILISTHSTFYVFCCSYQSIKLISLLPQAAGIPREQALGIGIAVDHRRRNKSEETFQENVQLLKKYRANLILFPRRAGHPRKGDSSAAELSKVEQQEHPQTVGVAKFHAPKAKKVEQPKTTSFTVLRRARADARLVGKRKKRAAARAEAEKLKAKSES